MNIKIYNKKNISQKGFSLVETLVAITILLVAVTGPLTIAHKSLSAANSTKNQMTAVFLAQDVIEYIRNVRDTNILNDRGWLDGFSSCTSSCYVDTVSSSITSCGGNCPALKQETSSSSYGHALSWEDTIFTREFVLSNIAADEARLKVTILWSNGTLQKSLEVEESIFKWAQ